ncbi:electron transport complex subunit RsxC [[Clostridium] polysaccharolyticum]|uniref:Ion-translocating oxidoreductase complex subunit C n=1 Tax=[Clostridium] polysaccharolyticum TaxID=29364 RepID=A0A1I0BT67_9FIRM|nr:electron transport complex subunit RsxC [[Clostridium] polysaccharolyticum]SET10259.1 electron transport complex protein RnfC [[Clostridium] polysaccharolyticum]
MKALTFRGGIHPFEGKDLSKDLKIKEVLPKGLLVYPMSQHIGAPATPIVAKGDRVLVGQRIGEASGFVSAHVYSSVSGTVKAVEPRLTVSGAKVLSVVIENDNTYEKAEGVGQKRNYEELSKEDIRNLIKEAGIVGMGGAGFPTHIKLTPKEDSKIEYVIVNGAECEPYLTSDYRVMLEEPENVVQGLKVILKLFEHAQGIIAIEDNKPEAIKIMSQLVQNESKIQVKVLKTKYPQGAERQLIYATTKRKINSAMLPADAGCVVDNVDTVVAVKNAVCDSTPLIRRIVTVTGDAIKKPQNFKVPTGLNYAELVEEAGGFVSQPEKVVSGGPMMGMALFDLNVPVMKTSSALLCMTKDEVAANEPSACIRCGRCVEACPSKLIPQKMLECSERFDDEGFVALNGMECYECGSCTYVCPAKRRLTQSFKQTRRSILDSRRKK